MTETKLVCDVEYVIIKLNKGKMLVYEDTKEFKTFFSFRIVVVNRVVFMN